MSEMLLEMKGLCKAYPGFAVKDVSLTVEAGSIVGLVGANGAGKTTTLKCLLDIIFPDAGSIRLMGQEVSRAQSNYVGDRAFTRLRQHLGYVPDTCAFPLEYTVKAVGSLCAQAYESWDRGVFAQMCSQFDLGEDKKVQELSRGMGMKLSLACALAHHPQILVLDEATAGLDPLARQELLDYLKGYVAQENCGVLMSSHITSDLEQAADRVVCLHEGKVAFAQDLDEICDRAGVARCTADQLETLRASKAYEPGQLRVCSSRYRTDVLVPDRFQFAEAFPEMVVERASLDEYMALWLKGDQE